MNTHLSRLELENDEQWLERVVRKINDPKDAIHLLLDNEDFLGYDPYYKDIREEILNACRRSIGLKELEL